MNEYAIAMDNEIKKSLKSKLNKLEELFESDVIFFYGDIYPMQEIFYRDLIEGIQDGYKHERLSIILNTPGGDVKTVEKLANINRHFYKEVDFIVPDAAMSAGTVFCLSGDRIYMEYSSSLGPIDPQVRNKQGQWIPALGYIDKMNEAISKSINNQLSTVEFLLLKDLDLGFLRECEQNVNLTVQLIKDWLVQYKFKDWKQHKSNGIAVTEKEKNERAEEIANMLSNNNLWCAHGRFIDMIKLRDVLHLEIEDYGDDEEKKKCIREYNALAFSYISRHNIPRFFHSRNFI